MGNIGSSRRGRRRHRSQPPLQPPQPEITANEYVYAAAAPHPSQNIIAPPYQQYPGYYPRSSVVPGPNSQPYHGGGVHPLPVTENLVDAQLPCGPVSPPVPSHVEHQKAVTIRSDVNIKRETLRIDPDQENPGNFLVAFTFDATAPGSITVMFFAKETIHGKLIAVKESLLKQVSMPFQQGLCQSFRQPSGTGINFSLLEERGLTKGDTEVYPLVLKADAQPLNHYETDGHPVSNCQITLASFKKREKGEYEVRVMKQILWVNGKRYHLQEIYGIANPSDGEFDGRESGSECVICLTEPRDITVLPCRHMCMCSGCAQLLRSDNCPICRHPVERLLEIKVNNGCGNP